MGGILGTTKEFIESWKLDQTCAVLNSPIIDESEPCLGRLHRKEWATTQCSLINTPINTNPFKECISKLDTTEIQKSYIECMFDACNCDRGGDCECLCSSLASFAELCLRKGVPVKWRTQHRCPIECEYGQEYSPCGSLCQKTCKDISTGNNDLCDDNACVEGCFCPKGYAKAFNGHCVLIENCECHLDDKRYPSGTKIKKGCSILECKNGLFIHTEDLENCQKPCNNKKEFTCFKDKTCIPIEFKCVCYFYYKFFLTRNKTT